MTTRKNPAIDEGQEVQARFADIDDQILLEQDDIYEQLQYANHFSSVMNQMNDPGSLIGQ